MNWVDTNVELLRSNFDEVEYRNVDGVHWVRVGHFALPRSVWNESEVELAFRIPAEPGEEPYAFWVKPHLSLSSGGEILNYTTGVTTGWGPDWGQFSFAPDGSWIPKADVRAGANMLNYVHGIAGRLREGS